jgi:Uma2 family endonuclease
MVAVRENHPRFTPEEYFAWEEQQLEKHEYLNGEVYAMTGGSLNHAQIGGNFHSLLDSHLLSGVCRVFNSDARVNILKSIDYVYPDISVTCDRRDRETPQYITYPCLIVEVLSSSTEAYDRGDKFQMYRKSDILRDYVLVSADKIKVELFHRDDSGKWDIIDYVAGDLVELESVNLTFSIEQVYRDIKF